MKKILTNHPYTFLLIIMLQMALSTGAYAQSGRSADDSVASEKTTQELRVSTKKDSPVLRTQIKEGLQNLGADIHQAWGLLKGDVKNAGKAGQKYLRNKKSADSAASGLEKRKEIVKVYSVSSRDKLFITNAHGEVSVSNWDKNEIRVEISIRVKGAAEKLLQESLNQVTIKESRKDNKISLETEITSSKETALQSFLKNRPDIDYQVNYKVFMPGQTHPFTSRTLNTTI